MDIICWIDIRRSKVCVIYDGLMDGKMSIAIIGIGYVGLPLAMAFAKKVNVIAFDNDEKKIMEYRNGIDKTGSYKKDELLNSNIYFTCKEKTIHKCNFVIIAVPTPVNENKEVDLSNIIEATKIVGRNMCNDCIVVYESTVYPGVTEEICAEIIEEESGLVCGEAFLIGYSPERINPGDNIHTFEKITKIVSGINEKAKKEISKVYSIVLNDNIMEVDSIKVAESVKLIENTQRDVNIAFMNEITFFLQEIGVNAKEVYEAMSTKWNALKFFPGLVGGHCISVDPYYLLHKAQLHNIECKLVSESRKVNESVSNFLANNIMQILKFNNCENGRVAVLGLAFKADCPDIRNSKVVDMINIIQKCGVRICVSDYVVDKEEVEKCYGISLWDVEDITDVDAVIFAVPHAKYKNYFKTLLNEMYRNKDKKIVFDIYSILDVDDYVNDGYIYWNYS